MFFIRQCTSSICANEVEVLKQLIKLVEDDDDDETRTPNTPRTPKTHSSIVALPTTVTPVKLEKAV